MGEPTTAELVKAVSGEEWNELVSWRDLLTRLEAMEKRSIRRAKGWQKAADKLTKAKATIKAIDTLLDNTWDTSSALLKGQSVHSKIKAIIKEHNDG